MFSWTLEFTSAQNMRIMLSAPSVPPQNSIECCHTNICKIPNEGLPSFEFWNFGFLGIPLYQYKKSTLVHWVGCLMNYINSVPVFAETVLSLCLCLCYALSLSLCDASKNHDTLEVIRVIFAAELLSGKFIQGVHFFNKV